MRLSTQGNQFIFNLPSDFLKPETINSYAPVLEKNWVPYENVIDYLNSTIKTVNFPGLSMNTPHQVNKRGKKRYFKPATNVQDIITTNELTITFRSVDADLNYWLMFDIINKHYLDVEESWIVPFTITCLDIHRDAIYIIRFYEVILKGVSDNIFGYNQQKINAKEFTLTTVFNFYDIEFLLDKSKVLELGSLPTIIQRI
jgi:hypothetical protein